MNFMGSIRVAEARHAFGIGGFVLQSGDRLPASESRSRIQGVVTWALLQTCTEIA
jgi:hypothetical protein